MHDFVHTTGGWKCSRCGLYGGLKNWPEYAGSIECWDAVRYVHVDDGSDTAPLYTFHCDEEQK